MSIGVLVVTVWLTLVELNCENLFDYEHDPGKNDTEWVEGGVRRWSPQRYWLKQRHIAQEIMSCSNDTASWGLPNLIALTEVENDRVLHDLTRRSLLRNAGYHYLMTESADSRGIDVALLYQPLVFRPLCYDCLTVEPMEGMRPTRDILYVKGKYISGDTLHVFVVHAPSKLSGARSSQLWRQSVLQRITTEATRIQVQSPTAKIIITGDFNDVADSPVLTALEAHGYHNISKGVKGRHGVAKASYRYLGHWQGIDHIFVSPSLLPQLEYCHINDAPFLLEPDKKYGGDKPFRTYNGYRFQNGFSDHLPLVVRFQLQRH